MPYAIVCLFGFISGLIATLHFLQWSFRCSKDARAPVIRAIHDRYASEFYDYCEAKCGHTVDTQEFLDMDAKIIEGKENAQKDSEQGEVLSEKGGSKGT